MANKKDIQKKGIGSKGISPERKGGVVGKSWFFGVGINHYRSFPPLNNAVKDVEDIRDLLLKKYDVDSDSVILLANEEATKEGIIDHLDLLVDKVEPEDKLIIYYSGHGHLDRRTGRGYWIPQNAEKGKNSEYIRNSTIRDYVDDIGSLHTLLISDACFSGTIFVEGERRSEGAMEDLENRPSRWAICSGRHDEQVFDGKSGENSPFAAAILNDLKRNDQPAYNVAKLADRVWEQTSLNYTQHPRGNPLFGVQDKGGQYIFRTRYSKDSESVINIPSRDAFQEDLKNQVREAVADLRTAYSEHKYLERNQLMLLARPFKRVAPTFTNLDILDELFDQGDDASIFAAAAILQVRRDPKYLNRLLPYIDKKEMRGSANWRVIRAVRDTIPFYSFSESELKQLTKKLQQAAIQRHTKQGPLFGRYTTLNLIRQVCKKLGLANEDIFTEMQLKELV